ncbi:hypothetical protein [Sphingobium chlorophenolicum]|uniref:Uncharacterized protein n=1 Tax=Sphingobium chlorophenolicum TaxID=46429 RepID=A0A081R861_SPHCR|nr:hypothetical protein [Sphingobium chlorophenolicum]KEQ51384.1 putative uncharacterized protein precursor [Sphingobium chlorophenolicum]
MDRMRWMTGSLMVLALLTGGAASAQGLPRLSYPQDQGDVGDEAQPPEDRADPPRADDDFSDVAGDGADAAPGGERLGQRDDPADRESDEAITYCALAARDEAERDGGYAEVRQVQEPRETRGGYDVEGDVEVRSGWRAQDGTARHFTCSVRNGRVADVWFQRDRGGR